MLTLNEPAGHQTVLVVDTQVCDWPILIPFNAHWQEARGSQFAPSLKTFNLPSLSFNTIPYTLVLDRVATSQDFYVRFWGTRLVRIFGEELTGEKINGDIPFGFMVDCWKNCLLTMDAKEPKLSLQRFSLNSLESLRSATLCAPLSTDGKNVDHVVVCMDFGKDQERFAQFYDSH